MGFANPVPGRILENKAPWPGPPTFRVTSTFAQHVASGRGPGIDIGNAREGAPVLTAAAGQITEVFIDPGGAVVVRMVHPQLAQYFGGKRVVTGYAHMQNIETRVGLQVAQGIAIGHVGSTGAPGQPHLHWGVNINGVEVDGWPLLDQNQLPDSGTGGDMDTVITRYPALRTWATKGGTLTGRRLDPPPLSVSGTFGAGSPAHASAEYQLTPTPAGWPAGPYQLISDGALAGYLVANADISLGPVPVCPPAGTGAELAAAKAEIAMLNAKITAAKVPTERARVAAEEAAKAANTAGQVLE